MISVVLLKFDKLKNSTARPEPWTQDKIFDGEIKGDFSPMSLEMTFNFDNAAAMPEQNYAYVYAFKRFYFITAWTYVGGLWVASMTVDVLATFRDEIKDSTQYVLRSQSAYDDGIIDTTYMQRGATSHAYRSTPASNFWGDTIDNGSIVVGTVCASNNNIGSVTYYAMNYATFNVFMRRLLSSISWMNIDTAEISEELQKALINPVQYIVSCVWLPIPLSAHSGVYVNSVALGWWSFSLTSNAVRLSDPADTYRKTVYVDIPKHPKSSETAMGFLRFSPFSRYKLKFLPFGVFDIDSSDIVDAQRLLLNVTMNPMTGEAVLDVATGDSGTPQHSILTTEANVGVQIPTGQIAANLGNMHQAITAGLVAGGNDLVNALMSAQVPSYTGGGGSYGGGGGRR